MARFFKTRFLIFILIIFSLFIFPQSVLAYSKEVIPGGETIGIQIRTKGVIVVGFYDVNNTSPGKDAGLEIGDTIVKINNQDVNNIDDLFEKIEKAQKLDIIYIRNDQKHTTTLQLVKSTKDNSFKTGIYVKDSITGIGTITFIDPQTNRFGALGHEIIDTHSKRMIDVYKGKIFESSIISINRSNRGQPGEKNSEFNPKHIYGDIYENSIFGIYGNIFEKPDANKPTIPVADISEVKLGKAYIYTVISDQKVEEFEIKILRVEKQTKAQPKGLLFEIVDQRLLSASGGIVQGMSGSPIIQDGKIIGAVTHVLVDDVTKGYGMHIKWMLEKANQ